jgi:hypothetical protein
MGKAREDLPEDLFTAEPKTSIRMLEWAGAKVDPKSGEVKPKPKPKRRATMAAGVFNRALTEVNAMMLTQDWSEFSARHVVALYDLMFKKTYGIEPVMTAAERHRFVMQAAQFVKREFGDDFDAALDFYQWLWAREIDREKWRRENGREGGSLSMWSMVASKPLNEYRLSLTRKRTHAR